MPFKIVILTRQFVGQRGTSSNKICAVASTSLMSSLVQRTKLKFLHILGYFPYVPVGQHQLVDFK